MTPPPHRKLLIVMVVVVTAAVSLTGPISSVADHESDNELTFEPVPDSPSPAGSGTGTIGFRGRAEPDSRWTAIFQFAGIQPETNYSTVVQGRFGEDDSAEAETFTSICTFRTGADGNGGCWHYLVGLRRLGVVQVRLGDENGPVVLQATKEEGGPGSLTGTANFHSLELTATPPELFEDLTASPVATN